MVIGDAGGNETFLSLKDENDTWPTIQVSVHPVVGSSFRHHNKFPMRVNIKLNSTVRNLKLVIANQLQLDLPMEVIRSWKLWYRNNDMEDHKSLGALTDACRLNIHQDRTIELGCKPLGGIPFSSSTSQNKQSHVNHRGNLTLFEEVSKHQTHNELAAQTRIKQDDIRLMTVKEIKEENATTLQPLETLNEEEKQRFNRTVNTVHELIRDTPGDPPEHRFHAFIRWMLAKTNARCKAGQTLSTELTQTFLIQEGNRTSVTILLRSRMENYTDIVSPHRCPTNIEVKSHFELLAETTAVSVLPQDEVDKRKQGTDFQITVGRARHGLTELTT
jgi:ribosomal protein L20A (L18A)